MNQNLEILRHTIVPVVVIDQELTSASAKSLVDAVRAGGSGCLEITLRTPQALSAIAILKKNCPDFIVGAGTVLDTKQAQAAINAGADFLVSPGLSPETVDFADANDSVMIPGVITPTEVQQAIALGLQLVKFFPAEQAGGAKMLKAFHSVYPQLAFMPTGGINLDNLGDYAALDNVFAVGGSWVCRSSDITNQDYAVISERLQIANSRF